MLSIRRTEHGIIDTICTICTISNICTICTIDAALANTQFKYQALALMRIKDFIGRITEIRDGIIKLSREILTALIEISKSA